jgi:predicted homoserine dehydrogenase-like protein
VYGSIERSTIAKKESLLPLGLAEAAVIKRNLKKGEYITYDEVELAESSFLVNLRKVQDRTFPSVQHIPE